MPENEDAWDLWMAVRTQWRGGGFGIIGLDYNVVMEMADRMGIEYTTCTRKKIEALERHQLMQHAKSEEKHDAEDDSAGCPKTQR